MLFALKIENLNQENDIIFIFRTKKRKEYSSHFSFVLFMTKMFFSVFFFYILFFSFSLFDFFFFFPYLFLLFYTKIKEKILITNYLFIFAHFFLSQSFSVISFFFTFLFKKFLKIIIKKREAKEKDENSLYK